MSEQIEITVSHPTVPEAKQLTKDDVWGKYDEINHRRIDDGMLVARGYGSYFTGKPHFNPICPIWGDELPYKSVTVVGPIEQEQEIRYWLEYVHGGGSVSKRKVVEDGKKVALRSDYMCW
jgi:hypothetical protein